MTAAEFTAARHQVLVLHRELVDIERRDYERAHGRLTPSEFLHHLLHDASFEWLKPLTAVIARMDEAEEVEDEVEAQRARTTTAADLRGLLRPREDGTDFQQRYAALLAQEPGLIMSHGQLMRLLSA